MRREEPNMTLLLVQIVSIMIIKVLTYLIRNKLPKCVHIFYATFTFITRKSKLKCITMIMIQSGPAKVSYLAPLVSLLSSGRLLTWPKVKSYIITNSACRNCARTHLQLPLRQWGASNVYLLVLSSWKVNIAEIPIAVMGL